MGPGDILKLGVIILPLVMFLGYVGTQFIQDTKDARVDMVTAVDGMAEAAGSVD